MSKRKSQTPCVVVKIVKSGIRFNAVDADGVKYTSYIRTGTRKGAFLADKALECREGKGGRIYWWKVPMDKFKTVSHVPNAPSDVEIPSGHQEVVDFISNS